MLNQQIFSQLLMMTACNLQPSQKATAVTRDTCLLFFLLTGNQSHEKPAENGDFLPDCCARTYWREQADRPVAFLPINLLHPIAATSQMLILSGSKRDSDGVPAPLSWEQCKFMMRDVKNFLSAVQEPLYLQHFLWSCTKHKV